MNNHECNIWRKIIDINNNWTLFYLYSIKINKCSGSFNNVNDSYTKLCIPYDAKNINVKAFNLMSRTIETRHIEWQETYKCKCRLDASF